MIMVFLVVAVLLLVPVKYLMVEKRLLNFDEGLSFAVLVKLFHKLDLVEFQ